jgi:hypothetical protein
MLSSLKESKVETMASIKEDSTTMEEVSRRAIISLVARSLLTSLHPPCSLEAYHTTHLSKALLSTSSLQAM